MALVWAQAHFDALLAALVVFFGAFNFLEARLPAMLTVAAGEASRGAALGVFATAQFLGAFAGGSRAGRCSEATGRPPESSLRGGRRTGWLPIARGSETR